MESIPDVPETRPAPLASGGSVPEMSLTTDTAKNDEPQSEMDRSREKGSKALSMLDDFPVNFNRARRKSLSTGNLLDPTVAEAATAAAAAAAAASATGTSEKNSLVELYQFPDNSLADLPTTHTEDDHNSGNESSDESELDPNYNPFNYTVQGESRDYFTIPRLR